MSCGENDWKRGTAMRLQSAIFDMDGTLMDSMPMWENLAPNILRNRGIEPRPDYLEAIQNKDLRGVAAYCIVQYGLTESVEEIEKSVWDEVEDFYNTKVTLKPGVQKVLSLMKLEGVWM